MNSDFASRFSRRNFLAAGAAAAVGSALPRTAAASDNGLFRVWVQLTTGGKPVLPSFFSIFADPMFFDCEVWPLDYPAENFMRLMSTKDRPARGGGPGRPGAPGAGRGAGRAPAPASNLPAPTNVNPPDYPWDPSGAGAGGVRSIAALQGDPGFDVLVLNDQTEWGPEARTNIERAVNAGHGFVVIHNALGDNNTWPTWYQELTGGLFVVDDHDGMKKSSVTHNVTMDVTQAGSHPIVDDLKPFRLVKEEGYKGMWQAPNITPLLQTSSQGSDKIIAWIGPSQKARVVCIQPGAAVETHSTQAYRRLIHNSIIWAAGRF